MMWICINIVLTTASACLIGYALYLQWQMRKLHKVQLMLGVMEMQQQGTLMFWRQRALTAERELKQLRGE